MKRFLAIFTGSPAALARWEGLTDAERNARQQAGMAAWHQWAREHQADIVDMGGPLGRTKLIGPGGISDIRNHMGGFSIVQAESQEAAAQLFIGHPHFSLFPGEGVEVMECLPVPGM